MKKIILTLFATIIMITTLSSCSFLKEKQLEFSLLDTGESYEVLGIGTLTDENIVIPEEYEGKSVTKINRMAFSTSNIKSITLPDTITVIEEYAFFKCTGLTNITVPEGVIEIKDSTFYGCTNLKNVKIGEHTATLGKYCFSQCINLETINIPNSIKEIKEGAFFGCGRLKDLVLPENLEVLWDGAFQDCSSFTNIKIPRIIMKIDDVVFYGCSSLSKIILPKTIESFGVDAFYKCIALKEVYYEGNNKEWEQIENKGSRNNNIYDATIYYYSETQPTTSGNYWHYAEDGVTPVKW